MSITKDQSLVRVARELLGAKVKRVIARLVNTVIFLDLREGSGLLTGRQEPVRRASQLVGRSAPLRFSTINTARLFYNGLGVRGKKEHWHRFATSW